MHPSTLPTMTTRTPCSTYTLTMYNALWLEVEWSEKIWKIWKIWNMEPFRRKCIPKKFYAATSQTWTWTPLLQSLTFTLTWHINCGLDYSIEFSFYRSFVTWNDRTRAGVGALMPLTRLVSDIWLLGIIRLHIRYPANRKSGYLEANFS